MENPLGWSDDTKAVQAAIDEWHAQLACGIFGYSLPMLIEQKVIVPLRKQIEELEKQLKNNDKIG